MNSKTEEIDSAFCEIWSSKKKMECGDLFLNPSLLNDIFFNKLTNVTCINESMINETILEFGKINSQVFVYSLNYPEFENFLIKRNFTHYDTQYVLKKEKTFSTKTRAQKITPENSMIWSEIFCKAYDRADWIQTVDSIVKNSALQMEYYVDNTHSSCMALIEKHSILGLYCLGTIPEKRNQGLALGLIDFALWKVNDKKLEFLMLEAYQKDNILDFYKKLGFEILYEKKVYTI